MVYSNDRKPETAFHDLAAWWLVLSAVFFARSDLPWRLACPLEQNGLNLWFRA
jgi:hypothetical protein